MDSFFYPTRDSWFEKNILEGWKNSGKKFVSFPFLEYEPKALTESGKPPFWMYLYYSERKTQESTLKGVVKFRVLVDEYSLSKFEHSDIFTCEDTDNNPTVWFKCSRIEEIRNKTGSYLTRDDFKHSRDKNLLSSIRNSIAPVRRITDAICVQVTYQLLMD